MNTSLRRRSSRPNPDARRWPLALRRTVRHFLRNPTVQNILAATAGLSLFLFNLAVLYRFCISPLQNGRPQWYVGTSKIDITPSDTVWMSGFACRNRTAESVIPLSPLFARAVAIRHEQSPHLAYVIVSADVIGLDQQLADRIYNASLHEFHLPRERLRICVTHTHSGPVIGNNLAPLVPEDTIEREKILRYTEKFYFSIMSAIRASLAEKVHAVAHFGRGTAKLAVNRRQIPEKDFDGVNRGTTEDSVPVLWFTNARSIVAGLFGYAAHATVLTTGYRYTGDFVGMTAVRLEKDGGTWLFLAGCGGDQNVYPRGSTELATRYANILSGSVQAVVKSSRAPERIEKISARHSFVLLPFQKRYKATELRLRARSKNQVTRRAANLLLNKLGSDGLTARNYRVGIAVWYLNDLAVAFLGGEPTVGYCAALNSVGIAWVIGYCEDVMGYIGTREVIADGGREGGERAAWYYGLPAAWNESVEDIIVESVRSNLRPP